MAHPVHSPVLGCGQIQLFQRTVSGGSSEPACPRDSSLLSLCQRVAQAMRLERGEDAHMAYTFMGL